MSLFKPVLVENKTKLNTVPIIDGQYIIVIDANELYLDHQGSREKASQNVYIQLNYPESPKEGDIFLQTEVDWTDIQEFTMTDISGIEPVRTYRFAWGMNWETFIYDSRFNTNNDFYLDGDEVDYNYMRWWASGIIMRTDLIEAKNYEYDSQP